MKPLHVLFVCTGNSARSILAEASLNHSGQGRFVGSSAGSKPAGQPNPWALRQLQQCNISSEGCRSKSWDEFSGANALELDIVITVCDSAAQETCPVLFGDFVRSHWGLPDPAAVVGSDAEIAAAFAAAHRIVQGRIDRLIALPDSLLRDPAQRESLLARLDEIGRWLP